jgi:hypothetical protein
MLGSSDACVILSLPPFSLQRRQSRSGHCARASGADERIENAQCPPCFGAFRDEDAYRLCSVPFFGVENM